MFLVLTVDGLIALPRSGDQIVPLQGKNTAPWRCRYTQIESVVATKAAEVTRADHFGFKLKFYNRDADASSIVIVNFECKEQEKLDDGTEERKAGEQAAPRKTGPG